MRSFLSIAFSVLASRTHFLTPDWPLRLRAIAMYFCSVVSTELKKKLRVCSYLVASEVTARCLVGAYV